MTLAKFSEWQGEVLKVKSLIERINRRRVTIKQLKRGDAWSLYAPKQFCWVGVRRTTPKPFRWAVKAEHVDLEELERPPDRTSEGGAYGQPVYEWKTEATDQDRRQIARILAKIREARHR